MNIYSGECEHGECGMVTTMKDSEGTALFVGDIIAIASKDIFGINCFYGLSVVVDDRPFLVGRAGYKKPFIMGLFSVDFDDNWYIKKVKHWKDCVNGEHWKDYGFNYRGGVL